MAIHSRILAWEIPWTEEAGGLQSTGWQRVGHNQAYSAKNRSRIESYSIWPNPLAIEMGKLRPQVVKRYAPNHTCKCQASTGPRPLVVDS